MGLLRPLEEGDYEGLVSIMGHLFKVRERQEEYGSMFEPLAEIINLLKTYDVEMPEDVYILMLVRILLHFHFQLIFIIYR